MEYYVETANIVNNSLVSSLVLPKRNAPSSMCLAEIVRGFARQEGAPHSQQATNYKIHYLKRQGGYTMRNVSTNRLKIKSMNAFLFANDVLRQRSTYTYYSVVVWKG